MRDAGGSWPVRVPVCCPQEVTPTGPLGPQGRGETGQLCRAAASPTLHRAGQRHKQIRPSTPEQRRPCPKQPMHEASWTTESRRPQPPKSPAAETCSSRCVLLTQQRRQNPENVLLVLLLPVHTHSGPGSLKDGCFALHRQGPCAQGGPVHSASPVRVVERVAGDRGRVLLQMDSASGRAPRQDAEAWALTRSDDGSESKERTLLVLFPVHRVDVPRRAALVLET